MAIMVLFFILFGSLTVMNMLLGVLVEAPAAAFAPLFKAKLVTER